ncbi:MAG: hypothetical protein R3F35_15180 [Myxococcota bacterium]
MSTRRLRRSVVIAADGETISVRFVGEPFAFAVDQEVLMYFNGKREFMQQVARITEIQTHEPADEGRHDAQANEAVVEPAAVPSAPDGRDPNEGPIFVLEPVGDPISAEARQTYRVTTIGARIEARVGSESGLPVQDLSSTGFAVLASEIYLVGQTVDVAIRHGDEACTGKASVQSFRELDSGRLRYGLRAIAEDPRAQDFLSTLQRISLAVQRDQLKRSGAVAD